MVSSVPNPAPDWEAFYRDYRQAGYIDGFEITSKLGSGMFGLVFRARKLSIGKDYAIKFLRVDDVDVRRAVLSELEQVKHFAQIDHPNLVSIEDRGEVDGIPYLIMAFAGSETLRDRLAGSGVPTGTDKDDLLRWWLQTCRGLAALHERSLVHFDVKPANVFLKGGVARLGDYGLSKLVTHSCGSLSMGRGTPYYMAPEVLHRRGDHRSDVYSLGVMLYEILCGKVPFVGDSEWEVLRQHESTTPVLPEHLTAVERTALQRCLAKDPDDRFESAAALEQALCSLAGETAGTVVSPHEIDGDVAALPSCVAPDTFEAGGAAKVVAASPAASGGADSSAAAATAPSSTVAVLDPPAPRPRRSGRGLTFVVLLSMTLAVTLMMFSVIVQGYRSRVVVRSDEGGWSMARVRRSAAPRSLDEQVDQFVAGVLRTARRAAQRNRPPVLQSFEPGEVQVPRDFDAYRELLLPLAEAPMFVPGQARKLEYYGRPMLLSGIALLQELDYRSARDCRQAVNVHRLLAHMTSLDRLVVELTGAEPSAEEICRLRAVAAGWRRFAEQFAADDETYQRVLRALDKDADVHQDYR